MRACLPVLLAAACAGRAVDSPRMAERLPDRTGLEGVARIHGNLYRGAQPDPETGYAALRAMGIRTVINLRKWHDFERHARAIARAGIYDFQIHHDQILAPVVLRQWGVERLTGLTDEAERARDALLDRIERIGRAGRRLARQRADEPEGELVGQSG